jgi:hypothetical protein
MSTESRGGYNPQEDKSFMDKLRDKKKWLLTAALGVGIGIGAERIINKQKEDRQKAEVAQKEEDDSRITEIKEKIDQIPAASTSETFHRPNIDSNGVIPSNGSDKDAQQRKWQESDDTDFTDQVRAKAEFAREQLPDVSKFLESNGFELTTASTTPDNPDKKFEIYSQKDGKPIYLLELRQEKDGSFTVGVVTDSDQEVKAFNQQELVKILKQKFELKNQPTVEESKK